MGDVGTYRDRVEGLGGRLVHDVTDGRLATYPTRSAPGWTDEEFFGRMRRLDAQAGKPTLADVRAGPPGRASGCRRVRREHGC